VLVVGGRSNNCAGRCPVFSLNTTEIYDATTRTSALGPLLNEHHVHAFAFRNLANGDVIILSGSNSNQPVPVAEVFR